MPRSLPNRGIRPVSGHHTPQKMRRSSECHSRWREKELGRLNGDPGTAPLEKSQASRGRQDHPVPARDEPRDRGRRAARRSPAEVAGDLRSTRLALGLSQSTVAAAAGISRSYAGRLERSEIVAPNVDHLASMAATLGLRLRFALYPDGEPVRDRVQLQLLERLRGRIHPTIAWRTEVPIPVPDDRRAWDAVAMADDGWTGIEAISRLRVVDATLRSVNQKLRDDPRIVRVVLAIADTVRNRAALRSAITAVRADYPLDTRTVLSAWGAGQSPPLSGIVLIRLPGPRGARAPMTRPPDR